MEYDPKHLEPWTMPEHYAGKVWPEFYRSGFGKSRDSSALERANFDAALEWIAIHYNDDKALQIADKLREDLDAYPVVDESLLGEYETEDAAAVWDILNRRERLEKLAEDGCPTLRESARDPHGFLALNNWAELAY